MNIFNAIGFIVISSSIILQLNITTINRNNNKVVVRPQNIQIDTRTVSLSEVSISIEDFPVDKIAFEGTNTEILDKKDPRVIDDIFTYSDDTKQVALIKKRIKNPDSGYQRLIESYNRFFQKYKDKVIITGNRIPLTILNKELLDLLGRKTNNPLKPHETVQDIILLKALYNSWIEKNGNY